MYRDGLRVTAILLGLVIGLVAWQKWTTHEAGLKPLESYPISAAQIHAASSWLIRSGYSVSALRNESVAERAKRINFLTYRFCKAGADTFSNPLELYNRCEAECAGHVYFYRGLAAAVGLNTRLVNFYTIPAQLDHTAVEVLLDDGRWGFVDPTYGAIFTDTGHPSGKILHTVDVTSRVEKLPLQRHVIQANKREDVSYLAPLERLYDNHFVHQGMLLSSYQSFEALSHNMPNEIVALEIPLVASNTQSVIGAFDSGDPAVLEKAWQRFAARTFGGVGGKRRPVSPVASDLSNDRENVLTIFTISALRANETYKLLLRVVNSRKKPRALQWGGLGREAELGSDAIVTASPGVSTVGVSFIAREPTIKIYIHNLERRGVVKLYAAKLIDTRQE